MIDVRASIEKWRCEIIAFTCTAILLIAIGGILHMAPFGSNALSAVDARIQYLDFFSYGKGILTGIHRPFYTFDKALGGNIWGVVAYYMLSPFNLFILFFDQSQFNTFYNLLVVIKLSLCSATMAFYLRRRFESLSSVLVVLLAVSFGLMQYNLEQAKNIMWLDPIYMLPLLLWGTYKVQQGEGITFLTIVTALSLVMNWYMGFIVAMFAGIWSVWEYIYLRLDGKFNWKDFIRNEMVTAGAILLAVGIIGIILVPAFAAMATGRAGIDWHFLNLHYDGKILALLQGLTAGAVSDQRKVSLFCGSLGLFGFISYFVLSDINRKQKLWAGLWIIFALLVFYWKPFFFLFSLLKDASSYWYRYSFVAIVPILYLAAEFYAHLNEETFEWKNVYWGILVFPLLLLIRDKYRPFPDIRLAAVSCAIFCILLLILYFRSHSLRKFSTHHPWIVAGLSVLLLGEIGLNTGHLMYVYRNPDVKKYQDYVQQVQKQVRQLPSDGIYRVNQTKPFLTWPDGITANFNEPLAYGYRGISSYTSSPDNTQLHFMDRMGYRQGSDNLNVIVGSVLGTDSLLGVRYILSAIPVNGYQVDRAQRIYNKESVYFNPYALPIAFLTQGSIEEREIPYSGNPFDYQNKLFSYLSGKNADLYMPLESRMKKISDKEIIYTASTPDVGNVAIYGNIPTPFDLNGNIWINSKQKQGYSRWLAPSVFYIPHENSETSHDVKFVTERPIPDNIDPQFYALDLEKLGKIVEELRKGEAEITDFRDGYVKMNVSGQKGQLLFTSIPTDKGWNVRLNGRKIKPVEIAGCLMGIVLDDGQNTIEMDYILPGGKAGIAVSAISLLILGFYAYKRKRGASQCK